MVAQQIAIEDTELATWFERDRAHVALYLKADENRADPLLDLWDDAVTQAIEDGFLKRNHGNEVLHRSAFEYARDMGMFDPENRRQVEHVPMGIIVSHESLGIFLGWKAGPVYEWSLEADAERIAKGVYAFSSEDSAVEFFEPLDEDDQANDYQGKLSFHQVELDISVPNSCSRRASIENALDAVEPARAAEPKI